MLIHTEIAGQPATLVWLKGKMKPCFADEAEYARAVLADGKVLYLFAKNKPKSIETAEADWWEQLTENEQKQYLKEHPASQKVYYHGTRKAFPSFEAKKTGRNEQLSIKGIHLAEDPDFANFYAEGKGGNVRPVRIVGKILDGFESIKKDSVEHKILEELLKSTIFSVQPVNGKLQPLNYFLNSISPKKLETVLKKYGYAGIRYNASLITRNPKHFLGLEITKKIPSVLVFDSENIIPLYGKSKSVEPQSWHRPILEGEARASKVAEAKALVKTVKSFPAFLTGNQARDFIIATNKIDELTFELARPLNPEKIKSAQERMSTLITDTIITAHHDLFRYKPVYDAISNATHGVKFNANTEVDRIMLGENKEVSPAKLYHAFDDTRAALRKQYGDKITLYRAVGKQMKKPTTNWATTLEYAKQFGPKVIKKEVPIEDIIAVNVGPGGNYHEFIVGDQSDRLEIASDDELHMPQLIARRWKVVHRSSNLDSLKHGFQFRALGISFARLGKDHPYSSPTVQDAGGRKGLVKATVDGRGLDYNLDTHKQYIEQLYDQLGGDTAVITALRKRGVDWVSGWNGIGKSAELHVLNPKVIIIRKIIPDEINVEHAKVDPKSYLNNPDGTKKVFYHGSSKKNLTHLDPKAPASFRASPHKTHIDPDGVYFTSDPNTACNYGYLPITHPDRKKQGFGQVYSAHIYLKNPLDITDDIKKYQKKGHSFGDAKYEALQMLTPEHDGYIFRGDRMNKDEVCVFKPDGYKLIKLATLETAGKVEHTEDGPVYINPTSAQVKVLSKKVAEGIKNLTLDNHYLDSMDDTIRAIKDSSNTWYVWDASIGTHGMIGELLGLSGKLDLYRASDDKLQSIGYKITKLRPVYNSSLGLEFMRKFNLKRPRRELEAASKVEETNYGNVYIDPTPAELKVIAVFARMNKFKEAYLRVINYKNHYYVWDGHKAIHFQMAAELGIPPGEGAYYLDEKRLKLINYNLHKIKPEWEIYGKKMDLEAAHIK